MVAQWFDWVAQGFDWVAQGFDWVAQGFECQASDSKVISLNPVLQFYCLLVLVISHSRKPCSHIHNTIVRNFISQQSVFRIGFQVIQRRMYANPYLCLYCVLTIGL